MSKKRFILQCGLPCLYFLYKRHYFTINIFFVKNDGSHLIFSLLKKGCRNIVGKLGANVEISAQMEAVDENAAFAPSPHIQKGVHGCTADNELCLNKQRTFKRVSGHGIPTS